MELKGTVIAILEMRGGTSQNGKEWKSQDFVIETLDQYPKKICINMFGQKVDEMPQIGAIVDVQVNIESREYNGKWFTTVSAWKLTEQAACPQQNIMSDKTESAHNRTFWN